MSESFEDAERKLRQILSQHGGSANAYDDFKQPVSRVLPTDSFEAANASLNRILKAAPKPVAAPPIEDHGLTVEEGPTPEEEAAFHRELAKLPPVGEECGTLLADRPENLPPTSIEKIFDSIPRPINPDYRYAGPVENAGDLYGIWNDFRDLMQGRPNSDYSLTSEKEWRRDDSAKLLRYETESQENGFLVWVYHLNGPHADKIGYMQEGFVFIRR